jgi:hypothetical protein
MERVINAFEELNRLNLAARIQASFNRRIQLCIEQEGRHFKHSL